jgi:hypothetical protein
MSPNEQQKVPTATVLKVNVVASFVVCQICLEAEIQVYSNKGAASRLHLHIAATVSDILRFAQNPNIIFFTNSDLRCDDKNDTDVCRQCVFIFNDT